MKPDTQQKSGNQNSKSVDLAQFRVKDVPTALISYSVISCLVYVAICTSCYILKPSVHFGKYVQKFPRIKNCVSKIYESNLVKGASKFKWLNKLNSSKHITIAIAEGLTVSTLAKPIIFPIKLWTTWMITKRLKLLHSDDDKQLQ
eukprot:TRINITY_DN24023_c0_g5_i1.p3 TRINITY_DN24023_c0_g5~~TRINITY_DN24023_c0_g5_i1.p3  ORF type:complete len:145 (-),score=3.93 TRINITY_DN24023_c0_g5_i1:301-735(-)